MSNYRLVKWVDAPVVVSTNLNPRGEWDNSATYAVADVVSYQGSSYICVTGNTNELPTNTTYWQVLAAAGSNIVTVRNNTGATLYKGTVVYINGSTGNHPTVAKARANAESTSAQTLGFVAADIANNTEGQVQTSGNLFNLDTRTSASHPFTDTTLAAGDQLYLSPDTAGHVTNVKPSAPSHLVYVGKVVATGTSNGEIYISVQNGFELGELHDVALSSVGDNQVIQYEASTSLWKNKTLDKTTLGLNNVDNVQQMPLSYLDTDPDLTANSNVKVPSQKAIKTYVDTVSSQQLYPYKLVTTDPTGVSDGAVVFNTNELLIKIFYNNDWWPMHNLADLMLTDETGQQLLAENNTIFALE